MNNKGQSLIIFVILLPVILLFIAYILVAAYNFHEKNKIILTVRDNLKIMIKNNDQDIEKLEEVIQDNIGDAVVDISLVENDIKVLVETSRKGLFDNLYKNPKIKVVYCGNYVNHKIYECS